MFRNIIANAFGRFWSVFANYLFIPLYIDLLGIESYSIISFSLVLLGIISILDLGLTATLSKEFANKKRSWIDRNKLFSTLEYVYLFLIVSLIFIFTLSSNSIASNWLNLDVLSSDEVSASLKILGVGLSLQLLSNFYFGGLIGLEKQVTANLYQISFGIAKNGLVILILLYSPSLIYFFVWQTCITLVYVIFLRYKLIKSISDSNSFFLRPRFSKKVFLSIWGFAAGMILISVVSSINTQLDKIILSKLMNISELGIYNVANSLSQALFVLVTPFSVALLPRLTSLYSMNNRDEAAKLFHFFLFLVCIIVFSVANNLIFNSNNIIYAWTGNLDIAKRVDEYLPYMILGTSLLVILMLPFNVAIANSYTKLNIIIGIISLFLTIPAYIVFIDKFGPRGAAVTWFVLQLIIFPIYIILINKKYLKIKSSVTVLVNEVLKPFALSLILAYTFYLITDRFQTSRLSIFFIVCVNVFFTLAICFLLLFPFVTIKRYYYRILTFIRLK